MWKVAVEVRRVRVRGSSCLRVNGGIDVRELREAGDDGGADGEKAGGEEEEVGRGHDVLFKYSTGGGGAGVCEARAEEGGEKRGVATGGERVGEAGVEGGDGGVLVAGMIAAEDDKGEKENYGEGDDDVGKK